ncbi:MAG: polysaccharide pyruvyl transferase family protein [Candidatus Peribacteraceae bacterium]|nr:polysaccharide pyruvyl transferase family protein [Candidatus Peribacteraceae bacterium]
MRIGILTFHASNNYGSVLQAYALCRYIHTAGHHAEIIDYRPNQPAIIGYALQYLKRPRKRKESMGQLRSLQTFLRRTTPLSRVCRTKKQIQSIASRYDALICGSDEIWNIRKWQRGFNRNFFLDGIAQEQMTASYAATFGHTTSLTSREQEIMRHALMQLNAISVRDSASAVLLDAIGISGAEQVLDPTLLLDWGTWAQDVADVPARYILAYVQRCSNLVAVTNMAQRLAQEYQLPVLSLDPAPAWHGGKPLTPEQWVGMYKNAEMIVTNAFHGVMFAVALQKPWIAMTSENKQKINDFAVNFTDGHRVVTPDTDAREYLQIAAQKVAYKAEFALSLQRSKDFLARIWA